MARRKKGKELRSVNCTVDGCPDSHVQFQWLSFQHHFGKKHKGNNQGIELCYKQIGYISYDRNGNEVHHLFCSKSKQSACMDIVFSFKPKDDGECNGNNDSVDDNINCNQKRTNSNIKKDDNVVSDISMTDPAVNDINYDHNGKYRNYSNDNYNYSSNSILLLGENSNSHNDQNSYASINMNSNVLQGIFSC